MITGREKLGSLPNFKFPLLINVATSPFHNKQREGVDSTPSLSHQLPVFWLHGHDENSRVVMAAECYRRSVAGP